MQSRTFSDTLNKDKEDKISFSNHKYVNFVLDESQHIGIITFKNINEKKNIFENFINEFKTVLDYVNDILSKEESNNKCVIKEFNKKDNYLIQHIQNRIPYIDNKLKVLILHSIDKDVFLKSMDINSFLKNDEEVNIELSNTFRYLCNVLQNLPLITISLIKGHCLNSGMDIILSTDFKIATPESTFGFDKICLGLYPSGGSVQKILRQIPLNHAKQLLFTSQTIKATEALEMNLIDVCMKQNEMNFINNSNVSFESHLSDNEKIQIMKQNIINYFSDLFTHEELQTKVNDDSFLFSLFFSFQFLHIPTYVLQNMKLSINEGLTLMDANMYLEFDKNIFEKNINEETRLNIVNYLKKKAEQNKIKEMKQK